MLERLAEDFSIADAGVKGVFCGGTEMNPQTVRVLVEEGRFVRAKAVLMATGGGPTMYRYHTPSGDKTMDGLAMALRVGLPLRDMEMVQFHPTGLLAGDHTKMTGTVLEEGLRGAGGQFIFVLPELDMVAVFTGWNVYDGQDYEYAYRLFYDRVVLTASDSEP